MLVPDLLHEFEIGVFKATFIHYLRILYAAGGDKIQDLNTRYYDDCTCGNNTELDIGIGKHRRLGQIRFADVCEIPPL